MSTDEQEKWIVTIMKDSQVYMIVKEQCNTVSSACQLGEKTCALLQPDVNENLTYTVKTP